MSVAASVGAVRYLVTVGEVDIRSALVYVAYKGSLGTVPRGCDGLGI